MYHNLKTKQRLNASLTRYPKQLNLKSMITLIQQAINVVFYLIGMTKMVTQITAVYNRRIICFSQVKYLFRIIQEQGFSQAKYRFVLKQSSHSQSSAEFSLDNKDNNNKNLVTCYYQNSLLWLVVKIAVKYYLQQTQKAKSERS